MSDELPTLFSEAIYNVFLHALDECAAEAGFQNNLHAWLEQTPRATLVVSLGDWCKKNGYDLVRR